MGIINRSKDVSEQKEDACVSLSETVTGKSYPIFVAPRAMQISDAKAYVAGMSGAPTGTLKLTRFVAGAGATTITISGALTHVAFATSGMETFSLPAAGSSLLDLQKNDVLLYVTGAANAALEKAQVQVVLKNMQDIKSWF